MTTVAPVLTRRPVGAPPTPLSRVVVATDFSPDGCNALRRAAMLPLAEDAEISVIHVLPRKLPYDAESVIIGAAEVELERAANDLREQLDARAEPRVKIWTRLARGRTVPEITRLIRARNAELLCAGGTGHGRLHDAVLGSTALSLIRQAGLPLLLVRNRAHHPYRQVLLGYDLTPAARRAAAMATRVTWPTGSIAVVHAHEDPFVGLPPAFVPTVRGGARNTAKAFRDRRALVLKGLKPILGPESGWALEFTTGDPRQVLLDAVTTLKADLLAVGTGRTPLERLALGSVAEACLRHSAVDVLIAPRIRGKIVL